MPTDDDQQPLITDSADYERVTGEFAALAGESTPEHRAWAAHYNSCIACQHWGPCDEGQRLLLLATGGQE